MREIIKQIEEVSYTVLARQREDTVGAKAGSVIYLESGEREPQWLPDPWLPYSTKFKTAEQALQAARDSDGMPWYYKPEMEKLEAIRLTKTFTAESSMRLESGTLTVTEISGPTISCDGKSYTVPELEAILRWWAARPQ